MWTEGPPAGGVPHEIGPESDRRVSRKLGGEPVSYPETDHPGNETKGVTMPIATPKQFQQMLDAAQKGGYAYPAINVTSIITLNAAFKGFTDSGSDGIIQFSTGAGQFA